MGSDSKLLSRCDVESVSPIESFLSAIQKRPRSIDNATDCKANEGNGHGFESVAI